MKRQQKTNNKTQYKKEMGLITAGILFFIPFLILILNINFPPLVSGAMLGIAGWLTGGYLYDKYQTNKKEVNAWVKKIINKIFCFHLIPMSIHLHNKGAWGIGILHIMYKEEESKALFKFAYSVISNKIQLHIFWIVVI